MGCKMSRESGVFCNGCVNRRGHLNPSVRRTYLLASKHLLSVDNTLPRRCLKQQDSTDRAVA